MYMILVEKDIPLPKPKTTRAKPLDYPFLRMEIGDSFFIPHYLMEAQNVRSAASQITEKHRVKFTVRQRTGGCRCWRIK